MTGDPVKSLVRERPPPAAMQDTERLLEAVEDLAAALWADDQAYRKGLEALAQGPNTAGTLDLTNTAEARQR